jgi:hypothetical protein
MLHTPVPLVSFALPRGSLHAGGVQMLPSHAWAVQALMTPLKSSGSLCHAPALRTCWASLPGLLGHVTGLPCLLFIVTLLRMGPLVEQKLLAVQSVVLVAPATQPAVAMGRSF